MDTLVLILVGILGVTVGYFVSRHDARERVVKFINEERHLGKEKRKRILLRQIRSRGRITNDEAEKLLNISHTTATEYFDELEAEGKIVEKGDGRGTYYEAVKQRRGTEPDLK